MTVVLWSHAELWSHKHEEWRRCKTIEILWTHQIPTSSSGAVFPTETDLWRLAYVFFLLRFNGIRQKNVSIVIALICKFRILVHSHYLKKGHFRSTSFQIQGYGGGWIHSLTKSRWDSPSGTSRFVSGRAHRWYCGWQLCTGSTMFFWGNVTRFEVAITRRHTWYAMLLLANQ